MIALVIEWAPTQRRFLLRGGEILDGWAMTPMGPMFLRRFGVHAERGVHVFHALGPAVVPEKVAEGALEMVLGCSLVESPPVLTELQRIGHQPWEWFEIPLPQREHEPEHRSDDSSPTST